jgi:hypothetical protein
MARMVDGLHQRLSHKSCGGNRAVEARVVHHLDNGLNASSPFSNNVRPSLRKFNFTGSVGAIAKFVLKTLDMEFVAFARGRPTRQQETGKSPGRLGENEKRVTHRGGTKPFMPGDQILA